MIFLYIKKEKNLEKICPILNASIYSWTKMLEDKMWSTIYLSPFWVSINSGTGSSSIIKKSWINKPNLAFNSLQTGEVKWSMYSFSIKDGKFTFLLMQKGQFEIICTNPPIKKTKMLHAQFIWVVVSKKNTFKRLLPCSEVWQPSGMMLSYQIHVLSPSWPAI